MEKKKRLRTAFARVVKIKCSNVSLFLSFSNILCLHNVKVVILVFLFRPFGKSAFRSELK